MTATQEQSVAFIGLGNMGLPMARRLIENGYPIRGFDVGQDARAALGRAGGLVCEDLSETCRGATAVILMLPNSGIVESVVGSLIDGRTLSAGTTLLDMSSSDPMVTRVLADRLAAVGVTLVDAPVSGGVKGAENGSLTIMVGGASEAYEHVCPLLTYLGRPRWAGPVGAGHAVKAINNLLSATHLLSTAEGIRTGAAFGLDPALMVEIINTSSGRSGSTDNKYPNFVLPETFDSGFGLRLMLKDMRIATDLAAAMGVPTRIGARAVEVWSDAADELPADSDHTEIARWINGVGTGAAAADGASREVTPSEFTDDDLHRIKDDIVAIHGQWDAAWQSILDLRPAFLDAYTRFAGVPAAKDHLGAKTRELIYLAVDVAATHLHVPGIRRHIRAALRAGATPDEVMEVIELSSTVGVHALNIGVPLLAEVLEQNGLRTGPAELSAEQVALREQFTRDRGYWHEFWDRLLEMDPEIFAGYTEFSSVSWRTGTLPAKVKEFVYIAFDAAATHLYVPGLRLHMQNALGYGATTGEILEILEIASVMGMQSATTAFPVVAEALASPTEQPDSTRPTEGVRP